MGPADTEVMVSPPAAGWVGVSIMGPAETEVMVSPPPTCSATSQNSLVGSVSL